MVIRNSRQTGLWLLFAFGFVAAIVVLFRWKHLNALGESSSLLNWNFKENHRNFWHNIYHPHHVCSLKSRRFPIFISIGNSFHFNLKRWLLSGMHGFISESRVLQLLCLISRERGAVNAVRCWFAANTKINSLISYWTELWSNCVFYSSRQEPGKVHDLGILSTRLAPNMKVESARYLEMWFILKRKDGLW